MASLGHNEMSSLIGCVHAQNDPCAGWETKIFWHSPEMGSLLYSLYKIPLAQACFPLAQPNFRSHWGAGERQFPSLL